ncbi:hypothetical protein ACF0H5_004903 [Mactra antiquata]
MSALTRKSSTSSFTKRTVKPRNRTSRGSRISLASEKDDIELINLDSDDDNNLSSRNTEKVTPAQAWAAFEECIKTIDSSSQDYLRKKPKPKFVASGTFQKVMVDMYGNSEYGNTKGYTILKQKLNNMARSTMMASRMLHGAVQKGQEEREREEAQKLLEEAENKENAEPESAVQVCAKRGWKVLKRGVNETVMEHKLQSTKLNWSMLQHTLKQMTNTERARQDLYERYGIVPTTLPDGTVVCENRMLSERARAQLHERNKTGTQYKRPKSYQPPTAFSRASSRTSGPNTVTDSKNTTKQTKQGRTRTKRPTTAKA